MAVTGIATGAEPQLNVMMPPALTAALSAVNALALVQLADVPLPMTAVGVDTSTSCPPVGTPVEQVLLETGPPSGALPDPLPLPLPEELPLLEPLPLPPDEPLLLPLEELPPLEEPVDPDELPEPPPEELDAAPGPASGLSLCAGDPEEQLVARSAASKSPVLFMVIGFPSRDV